MLYMTKKGKIYKSDKGTYTYINDLGEYVIRLAKFKSEITLENREAFEQWLTGPRCYLFKEVA